MDLDLNDRAYLDWKKERKRHVRSDWVGMVGVMVVAANDNRDGG